MSTTKVIPDGTRFRFMEHVIKKKTSDGLFDYYEVWSASTGFEDGFLRVPQGTVESDFAVIFRVMPVQVSEIPQH